MSTRLARNRAQAGALWLCLGGVAAVHAAAPAEGSAAARGESIARMVCSACHVVASDQSARHLPAEAPSFIEIANRPATNQQALQKFIATTHWDMKSVPVTMPSPMLTDQQVRDVAHYILSLRSPPPANTH
jgi:mono/diheme cytochrome c family protein